MTAPSSKAENKAQVLHRPDWHPALSVLIGAENIIGSYAYVTPYNTIHLIGPLYNSPNMSKADYEGEQTTPTKIFSAEGGMFGGL